jgi:serine protease Do
MPVGPASTAAAPRGVPRGQLGLALLAALAAAGCSGCFGVPVATGSVRPPRTEAAAAAAPPLPAACACDPRPVQDSAAQARQLALSVVLITTVEIAKPSFLDDAFDFLFDASEERPPLWRRGQGAGFVVESPGLVVTAAHVVSDAHLIRARTSDGTELTARVVGTDPLLDLALLELDTSASLPAVVLGSSERLRAGDEVMAIGNPFGLGHSVTLGVVSGKGRAIGIGPFDDLIQTDAAINPGNSGGPLFDRQGQLVGITIAIHPRATGVSFAIPVEALAAVLPELRATGQVRRAALGVAVQNLTPALAATLGLDRPRGALVVDVAPDGSAAEAGLRPADVVLTIAGKPLERADDLPRRIAGLRPGGSTLLTILRDKAQRRVRVQLDPVEAPEERPLPRVHGDAKLPAGRALGVELRESSDGGVAVAWVLDARKAGELEPGDELLALDGVVIRDGSDLIARIRRAPPGARLLFRVRREDTVRFAAAQIAAD